MVYNYIVKLIKPDRLYCQSYLQAAKESKDEKGSTGLRKPDSNITFIEFVKRIKKEAVGEYLPGGYVPATELWLIDDNNFIGRVSIRHTLNDKLLKTGGHIGYWIRPSKRGLGYGKQILKLALSEAKKLGISKVLITCDDTNIASGKIIEANGGILENKVPGDKNQQLKRRYWINLE